MGGLGVRVGSAWSCDLPRVVDIAVIWRVILDDRFRVHLAEPGDPWSPLRAIGAAVVGVAVWWVVCARVVVLPRERLVRYWGLWPKRVRLGDAVRVRRASRLQIRPVACVEICVDDRSIKCRGLAHREPYGAERSAELLERILILAATGAPVTSDEVRQFRFELRPQRPPRRALEDATNPREE